MIISGAEQHREHRIWSDGQNGQRILALKEREVQPLIAARPAGRLSPSKSLLVERFDLKESCWQTHFHTDQVLAMHLKPTTMLHKFKDSNIAELRVDSGEVAICSRGEWESLHWCEPSSFLCVRVSDAALGEAANTLIDRDGIELVPIAQTRDHRLENLMNVLELERESGYPSGLLFLDSVEAALAALLVTSHATFRSVPAQSLSKGGLAPRNLRRVLDFMHTKIDAEVRLEDLAACARLSISHFSHQFRASTGNSPHQYMRSLRISRSTELLRDDRLSIADIALAVGFENQQHFATVFRRVVGVTPSGYRRRIR